MPPACSTSATVSRAYAELARAKAHPGNLAATKDAVYWTTGAGLMTAPTSGGAATLVESWRPKAMIGRGSTLYLLLDDALVELRDGRDSQAEIVETETLLQGVTSSFALGSQAAYVALAKPDTCDGGGIIAAPLGEGSPLTADR